MNPDDLARLEHGIGLTAAPHDSRILISATGGLGFRCDNCGERDDYEFNYLDHFRLHMTQAEVIQLGGRHIRTYAQRGAW